MDNKRLYITVSKLPSELQKDLKRVNKLIANTLHSKLKEEEYKSIRASKEYKGYAKQFAKRLDVTKDKNVVQIWPDGNKHECMIQITGHFKYHNNDSNRELLHKLIGIIYKELKPVVQKDYNLRLDYEYTDKEPMEGFDVYTSDDVAKDLYFKLKSKLLIESAEGNYDYKKQKEPFFDNYIINKIPWPKSGPVIDLFNLVGYFRKYANEFVVNNIFSNSSDAYTHIPSKKLDDYIYFYIRDEKLLEIGETISFELYSRENIKQNVSTLPIYIESKNYMNKMSEFINDKFKKLLDKEDLQFIKKDKYLISVKEKIWFFPKEYTDKEFLHVYDGKYSIDDNTSITRCAIEVVFELNDEIWNNIRSTVRGITIKYGLTKNKQFIEYDNSDDFDNEELFNEYAYQDKINNYNQNKILNKITYDKLNLTIDLVPDSLRTIMLDTYFPAIINELVNEIKKDSRLLDYQQKLIELTTVDFILTLTEKREKINSGLNANSYTGIANICNYTNHLNTLDSVIGRFDYQHLQDIIENTCVKLNDTIFSNGDIKIANYPSTEDSCNLIMLFNGTMSKRIWDYVKYNKSFTESSRNTSAGVKKDISPETGNKKLPHSEAERTLLTLTKSIITGRRKVSDYTTKTISNIISNNLLQQWAPDFKKINIKLLPDHTKLDLEFVPPKLVSSKDNSFIKKFIRGSKSLSSFLKTNTTININVSKKLFKTFNTPEDMVECFKNAIKYYDADIDKGANTIATMMMSFNTPTRELLSNELSGLVLYPLSLLFVFQNIDGTSNKTFASDMKLVRSLNQSIKSIVMYINPRKNSSKSKLDYNLSTITKIVNEISSNVTYTDNIKLLKDLPDKVSKLYKGDFDNVIKESFGRLELEQCDSYGDVIIIFNEAVRPKRLKKIPNDLIPYIIIEGESIKDVNDKMIITSYAFSKLEIIDWYIQLLEVGSKNYIVPHTKPQLELIRTELLAAIKKIMDTPVPKSDRPIIDIKYPKNYEG